MPRIRVTAICTQDERLLVLRQAVTESSSREWSLPGGGLEFGETLQSCLTREMEEETGLEVQVGDLIYVCDRLQDGRHVLHLTFEVAPIGGELRLGAEPEHGANPIREVSWVRFEELRGCGFSATFVDLLDRGFPDRGRYCGPIEAIGL